MKLKLSEGRMAALIVAICLIIDQVIKLAVKLNMRLYESIHVTDWFYIYFTENPGMAFGMEIFGKIFLTLFRIIAVGCFVYYLYKIRGKGFPRGYIACVALIIAGAAGNIFDCVFYGPLFSESTPYAVSEMVSWGDGYAPLLKGKVVDMFYFPLVEWNWPDWLPFIGGEHFIFFSPIFNFADACISCAVIAVLLFYSKCMNWGLEGPNHTADEKDAAK
ncbi:MAG: lipoprotein signal peptidase [Bacteroidales bacterium]|nr:lipoprotein signal peptidase [Bacteroidales bacterium]